MENQDQDSPRAQIAPNITSLDLSNQGLVSVSPVFTELPVSLRSMNLMNNILVRIPNLSLLHLTTLDISRNNLTSLQFNGELPSLDQLILNYNRLTSLDFSIDFPKLTVLCVCNNSISHIETSLPSRFPLLNVLDVSNNNIQSVPPELGLMQLSSLQLLGNPFRVPRPAVLQRGINLLMKEPRQFSIILKAEL